jgi:DNA-binding transcriptional LysR family regulator
MSGALRRLRDLFGDELLVRTANGMAPTPRALELVEPVRQLMRQAERVVQNEGGFEPGASQLRFRIRMSDVLEYLLLPRLLDALRTKAPGVALDVVHLSPAATVAALEADEIDLAVSMDLDHTGAVKSAPLFADRMVCLLDKRHPAAADMTLERFLEAPHLKVSISPTDGRYVDAALAAMRRTRRIALNVPHWLIVPHLLARSAMIAVISERLARNVTGDDLVVRDLPFASAPFRWSLYWHRRYDGAPAQKWLRAQLQAAAPAGLDHDGPVRA